MTEAARTGEFPQSKCRCRVERAARAVVPTRTARNGNSCPSSGGSRRNGQPTTHRSVLGDMDCAVSNFSSQLRRSYSSGDTSVEEEGEEEEEVLSDIGGETGPAVRVVEECDGVGGRVRAAVPAETRVVVEEYDGVGR